MLWTIKFSSKHTKQLRQYTMASADGSPNRSLSLQGIALANLDVDKQARMHEWPQCESCTAAMLVAVNVRNGPKKPNQFPDPALAIIAPIFEVYAIMANAILYKVSSR